MMHAAQSDGILRGLFRELCWWWRFLRLRQKIVHWRRPTYAENLQIEADPRMEPFGDWTVAVANLGQVRLVVRERAWSGWPDPPTYVVFAVVDGRLWMAWDFYAWPEGWSLPTDSAEGEERLR